MPIRRHSNTSDKRLSRGNLDKTLVDRTDETATQNYTRREFSRLRRLCIDDCREGDATEKTQVEIGINDNRTNRLVPVAGKKAFNRQQQTSPFKPLVGQNSTGVMTVATSTQTGSRGRMTADTAFGNRSTIPLDRRHERSDRRIANRFLKFGQIGYLWSKYRVAILLAVCSVIALALFLGVPILDNTQKTPSSVDPPKASKRAKQQNLKPRGEVKAKQIVDLRSAQKTTPLRKNAHNPSPLVEEQTSDSVGSSTPNERVAVDLLIAGRLQDAYKRYRELALQKPDQPVYQVIARTLKRQIAKGFSQESLPGNLSCQTPESK
jgi:hypothetical protein